MLKRDCSSGESGLGKSTLINTLFENKLFDLEQRANNAAPPPGTDRGRTVGIESLSSGEMHLKTDDDTRTLAEPTDECFRYRGKWSAIATDGRRHSWIWRLYQQCRLLEAYCRQHRGQIRRLPRTRKQGQPSKIGG